jgi:hypothetical protein
MCFDPHSDVAKSECTEARGRVVGMDVVMAPWDARGSNDAERGGMRVPMNDETAVFMPQGRRAYWRGAGISRHHIPAKLNRRPAAWPSALCSAEQAGPSR